MKSSFWDCLLTKTTTRVDSRRVRSSYRSLSRIFFSLTFSYWYFDIKMSMGNLSGTKMSSTGLQCLLYFTLLLSRTLSMQDFFMDKISDNSASRNTHPLRALQDGQCTYTFILPQNVGGQGGCWAPQNHESHDDSQGDSSLVKQSLSYQRIQHLEVVMDNYTQRLQKVESYVKDDLKEKMFKMQLSAIPNQITLLDLGSNLLSHTVHYVRRVTEMEMQVMNHTTRLEIQLLENSLSTVKLETKLIRQTSELLKLQNTTQALEQRMQDMEVRHRAEVGWATAARSRLKTLLTFQSSMIQSLELSLELAESNNSALYSHQKQLWDTVTKLLALCSKENVSTSALKQEDEGRMFRDCAELFKAGFNRSGIYTIHITLQDTKKVYCNMDTAEGGWTVIQLRKDGSQDFHKTWKEYKMGFGSLTGEHWLGNEFVFLLTSQRQYALRVELTDWDGQQVFSQYDMFQLASEKHKYRLFLRCHNGTAGRQSSLVINGVDFSTKDMDNDKCICRCALMLTGGWWFDACGPSNLNGKYYSKGQNTGKINGIKWHYFKGSSYSLRATTMMIRPVDF